LATQAGGADAGGVTQLAFLKEQNSRFESMHALMVQDLRKATEAQK